MREMLAQFASLLHLSRLTMALSVVGNGWFVVLWSRAEAAAGRAAMPEALRAGQWGPLLAASAVAFGLYALGAALNDILDLRRDRALHADRPIASGQLGMEPAIWLVVGTTALAVLGATHFGPTAVMLVLVLQLGILAYNAAARFVPALGILILACIHAGHMLVPNSAHAWAWAVWTVMTHATAVAIAVHIVGRKNPALSARARVVLVVGWLALSAVLIAWGGRGERVLWPKGLAPLAAVLPLALGAVFAAWGVWSVRRHGMGSRSAEKLARYGALWMPVYGVGWLLGAGHTGEAWLLAGLVLVASAGVALARELAGLLAEPVGYRR